MQLLANYTLNGNILSKSIGDSANLGDIETTVKDYKQFLKNYRGLLWKFKNKQFYFNYLITLKLSISLWFLYESGNPNAGLQS